MPVPADLKAQYQRMSRLYSDHKNRKRDLDQNTEVVRAVQAFCDQKKPTELERAVQALCESTTH